MWNNTFCFLRYEFLVKVEGSYSSPRNHPSGPKDEFPGRFWMVNILNPSPAQIKFFMILVFRLRRSFCRYANFEVCEKTKIAHYSY